MKRKFGLIALLTILFTVGITLFLNSNRSQAGDSSEIQIMKSGTFFHANDTSSEYTDVNYKFTPTRTALYAIFVSPYSSYANNENRFFETISCGDDIIYYADEFSGYYYLEKGKEYNIYFKMCIVEEFDYCIDYAIDGYDYKDVTPSKGRVYFDNTNTKWSNVHVWVWDINDKEWSSNISGMSVWPGPKAKYDETIARYYYDIPKEPGKRLMVIFNSGLDKNTGIAQQTLDMICPGAGYELTGVTKLSDSDKYSGIWSKTKKRQTITANNYTKVYGDKAFSISAKASIANTKFTYKSSNTNVVSVDSNGKATIKGAGKATITLRASGNSTYYTTWKKITITVNKASQSISASNVSKTYSNGTTFNINAKRTKGNGKLTYASSDKNVVTIDSYGKVKIIGNGKATITITASATSNYNKAIKKVTVTVKPAKVSITSIKSNAKKKMTVSWKRDTKVTGYEIQYSTSNKFTSGNKTVRVTNNSTLSKTISGLTSGKTYYVRVRSYRTYAKVNYYGTYSSYRSIKIK